MRVVPLFETLADLDNAGPVMERLLLPGYRARLQGPQEVMIGYSDSAKDAGTTAAAWAQYRRRSGWWRSAASSKSNCCCSTVAVAPWAVAAVRRTRRFCRSRRGRWRGVSAPPSREMIRFKFGLPDIAEQNLNLYLAAVLEATCCHHRRRRPNGGT
jgi:phosphoenolpyruvate carboxylase